MVAKMIPAGGADRFRSPVSLLTNGYRELFRQS